MIRAHADAVASVARTEKMVCRAGSSTTNPNGSHKIPDKSEFERKSTPTRRLTVPQHAPHATPHSADGSSPEFQHPT